MKVARPYTRHPSLGTRAKLMYRREMATLVLTAIGDDKAGLVGVLAGVISEHGGSWQESHMAELAGKFAGIVVVDVPGPNADALIAALAPLEDQGLLDISVTAAAEAQSGPAPSVFTLELVGQDRPGIVADISQVLADAGVSIDELHTLTRDAPMAGGTLFEANAILHVPDGVTGPVLAERLEGLANELMVDIDLRPGA